LEENLVGRIPFGEAKTFAALSCVKKIDLEEVSAVLIKMPEAVKGEANTIRVVVWKSSAKEHRPRGDFQPNADDVCRTDYLPIGSEAVRKCAMPGSRHRSRPLHRHGEGFHSARHAPGS
jgi:hypothetical protein